MLLALAPMAFAPMAFAQVSPTLGPCAADDARRDAGFRAVSAADQAMRAGELAAINAALVAAYDSPCLAHAAAEHQRFTFEHPAAARAWWSDGGQDWLRGELAEQAARWAMLPPSAPEVLDPERLDPERLDPADPDAADPAVLALLPILCPPEDAACAAPTAGWRLRAEGALDRHRYVGDRDELRACDSSPDYASWLACADHATSHDRVRLPVGAMRPLEEGWLTVRGPRRVEGRLRCEVLVAFDLSTGAAVSARSCEVVVGGFDAEGRPLNPVPDVELRAGQVPVDNLRELAWFMLLESTLTHDRVTRTGRSEAVSAMVPQGLTRALSEDARLGVVTGRGVGGGFQQQAWALSGAPLQASGTVWWPSYPSPTEEHLSELLAVVEAGWVEGCLPVAAPEGLGAKEQGAEGQAAEGEGDKLARALGDAAVCADTKGAGGRR